jgi:hypothetical protein
MSYQLLLQLFHDFPDFFDDFGKRRAAGEDTFDPQIL